ncbi:MAG TPA: N-acetyl-gamma-glutamyl-phosphate reductase [Candidatus Altiarchaeales archaeon]|nr:N-acetyl-gamma-glutamyl-phosphate reductase [Candidatus Altiarchaeales archaeon]
MVNVTVIGASGYVGAELIKILSNHPEVEKIVPVSRKYKGQRTSSLHRNLYGIFDRKFEDMNIERIDSDFVFSATPHGASMSIVPELIDKGLKIIDLSSDYRLSREIYEKVYGKHSNPELIKKAVYGLPELFRKEIKKAQLVANPGCYVTSVLLALLPLSEFQDKFDTERVIVDSKSGTSGAGAKPSEFLHHPEVHDNLKPYKITEHRHRPEMEYVLSNVFKKIRIGFTPTLIPIVRGILSNVYIFGHLDGLRDRYEDYYRNEVFVRIVETATVKEVVNTNFCDLSIHYDKNTNRTIIISVIDNLIKGASGQAVQNMNLMLGIDEKSGLSLIGNHP